MTYASDKLYNEVIRRKMAHLASLVKVREIVPHLPCLTLTDREEIDAKRETTGNYNAMVLLLDYLRRRQNWPEEFIDALRACDQGNLANEISDCYDTIKGTKPQRRAPVSVPAAPAPPPPPPPPAAAAAASVPGPIHVPPAAATPAQAPAPASGSATTVTTATVHDAPRSTPPLLTPSPVEALTPAPAPSQNHPPPQSLHSITATAPAETPATVSAPVAPAPPPPEPAQPSEPSAPVAPAPPPPEPAQPSEPSAPVSIPHSIPSFPESAPEVTAEQNKVSFNPGATPTLNSSDDSTLTAVSEGPAIPFTSLPTNTVISSPSQPNTPLTSSRSPALSKESELPLPVNESSTLMKQPIQDTNPPEKVLIQESNISSTTRQAVEMVPTVESPAQTASPERAQVSPSAVNDAVAGHLSQTAVADVEYFSKPGTLRGAEPSLDSLEDLQISRPPTETTDSPLVQPARPAPLSSHLQPGEESEEPCSVTSDDLMFSNATARITGSSLTQDSQHSSAVNTELPTEPVSVYHVAPENAVPHPTPEENSFRESEASICHNQPVEDHYESYSQSLQREPGTLVNVVQVYEEPSIQNLNGQPPSMIGNAVHTNDNPESTTTCQESGLNASGLVTTLQSQQREEVKESHGVLSQIQVDPRLIAVAAALGAAAVLMAWKFKH